MPKLAIVPNDKTCASCAHFRRHYTKRADGTFWDMAYGHCVYPRRKKRETTQSCQYWSERRTEPAE